MFGSAATAARIADAAVPHFADGVEKAAWEASHAITPARVTLRDQAQAEKIAHLEGVAERQADQHRIDTLKIQDLEAKLARSERNRTYAETVGNKALGDLTAATARLQEQETQLENVRRELGETEALAQELTRRSEVQAKDYRKVREALSTTEDQRDGYRRQLGVKMAELDTLRGKIRDLALELG